MRRLLAAVVVVAGAASSVGARQAPPPRDSQRFQTPIAPPSGTGRLAGRVISADAGEPLRNARVSLSPAAGDVPLVLTDGDGRFAFTGLPAGTYAVSAAKAGYAVPDGAAAVQLAEGARADVSVRLARGAAIAGRLLDEAGEPVLNANVLVEQLVETGGVRSTRARRAVQTNDIGEYRVGSLPAGVYVVSVVTPPQVQILGTGATGIALQLPPAAGRPANGPGGPVNLADVGRPRIFFPNAATLAEAEALPVKAGEERPSVDLSGVPAQLPFQDLGLAQDRSPTARDANARATSAIRGRVLGATGPLSGAQLRITGDAIRQLPPAFTDALGQYEFIDLPAGVYTLNARKNRYIAREFGQEGTSDRGTRITLAVDERRDRADITLPRTSAIAGQLTDEYGDPIEGATIRLYQIRFASGRRRLVDVPGASSSRTDDLGRYRVFGLRPGSYVLAAYVGQLVLGQPGAPDIPGYATTYYPGTPNPPESRLVSVAASQDVDGLNFAVSRIATSTVSGVALDASGDPITGGLLLSSSRRSGALATTPVGAYIRPDGSFEFRNVAPGQYVIQAYRGRRKAPEEGEFAAVPVTVSGSDIKGLMVQASAGSTITGRFTFDDPEVPSSRNITLSAIPSDPDLAPLDGNFARADVRSDWSFEMSGISGPRRLRLLQAPRGWGLERILVNGVDATDAPLPFGAANQSLADVEVVLTRRVTEVGGRVADDRGRAVADARVIVFAADSDLWYDRSRFLKMSASDAEGAFAVRDLPPGDYFVAAVDRRRASEDNGEWMNPELLESLSSAASRITLAEGQKISITPRLTGR